MLDTTGDEALAGLGWKIVSNIWYGVRIYTPVDETRTGVINGIHGIRKALVKDRRSGRFSVFPLSRAVCYLLFVVSRCISICGFPALVINRESNRDRFMGEEVCPSFSTLYSIDPDIMTEPVEEMLSRVVDDMEFLGIRWAICDARIESV
ncbi:hypothetical protein L873DRAFT_742870 [Choiromyces venosus 120613-1]|uniref:Uncharacterized protein n=1 Tax=Choiromyces venosus 120613-1 TaxID=1336337 RepID=A0A3N4JR59_9PEZI|nr:hypothetical protein L873DRAFT_742870 [Choiromyces venosus 120613-1]